MQVLNRVPFHNAARVPVFGQKRRKQRVYCRLRVNEPLVDVAYSDMSGTVTSRTVKPVTLTILANESMAVMAKCMQRQEFIKLDQGSLQQAWQRCGDPAAISAAEFFSQYETDIPRALALDTVINGYPASRRAARSTRQEPVLCVPQRDEFETEGKTMSAQSITKLARSVMEEAERIMTAIYGETTKEDNRLLISIEAVAGDVRFHVDFTSSAALALQEQSNHEIVAHLEKTEPLEKAATELFMQLMEHPHIGHEALTVRIAMAGGEPVKAMIAIDETWINSGPKAEPAPSSAETCGLKLAVLLQALEKNAFITPLGRDPKVYMVETVFGLFYLRAANFEEAPHRLQELLRIRDPLLIYGIGEAKLPTSRYFRA